MSHILHSIIALFAFYCILVNASLGSSDYIECPTDFVRLGIKCYKMERSKKNWHQAALDCRRQKADLVTIENANEMDEINNYIISSNIANEWFWTSANDLAKEGQFYWQSNGKPMTYHRFTTGEPNNRRGREHCVNLMHATENKRNQIEMNDNRCETELMSICEIKSLEDEWLKIADEALESAVKQLLASQIQNGKNLPYISY